TRCGDAYADDDVASGPAPAWGGPRLAAQRSAESSGPGWQRLSLSACGTSSSDTPCCLAAPGEEGHSSRRPTSQQIGRCYRLVWSPLRRRSDIQARDRPTMFWLG